MEAHPPERLEHFPALDGLRAIAIAGVVFGHVFTEGGLLLNAHHAADRVLIGAALRGWMGVDLFFVLSGFLITRILLEGRASAGYYRQFYARRALRIFPLYYTTLLLTLLVLPRVVPAFNMDHPVGWVYWLYVSNIPAALAVAWSEPLYLGHFWSLAIEEQFYVLWPGVVRRVTVRFLVVTCAAMVAIAIVARITAVLAGMNPYFNYKMLFTRMDALAMGGLLACFERLPGVWRSVRRHAPVVLLLGSLLVLVFGRGLLPHPLTQSVGFSANAFASAGLILMALDPSERSRIRRVLESGPLTYIGQRSYAIYVLHPIVIVGIAAIPFRWFALDYLSGLAGFVRFAVVAVAATVVLAEVSWRLVERPMLALKRFVPRPPSPLRSS